MVNGMTALVTVFCIVIAILYLVVNIGIILIADAIDTIKRWKK